ncbi:MAG: glycosyltransferase family 2 protein [Clostridiales bacterium]|nr:glycosyltransferase family 2 protein [Clostridiales bacterium]
MKTIRLFNDVLSIVFAVLYFYQVLYVLIALPKGRRSLNGNIELKRYAVLIAARNEERVLPNLIHSIREQEYPPELIDIFVVADNCTDGTALVAGKSGAIVWERNNIEKIGKGYALEFLFERIRVEYGYRKYAGYLILDADNLLDRRYIFEMNKSMSEGKKILTSYRNSKNFDSNWISAGYSLWFLREAKFLNRPRQRVGASCAISGTGFMISRDIVERNGGWKHFLLTEDIEFTVDSLLKGDTIGICETAVLYDEQPVSFRQSCRQRLRWSKGYLQVFKKYGPALIRTFFQKGSFSCFDMIMSTLPAVALTLFGVAINMTGLLYGFLANDPQAGILINSVLRAVGRVYGVVFAMGLLTTVSEWKMIHAKPHKKILNVFSFPFFMLTNLPISFVALFMKVEWKPIDHSISRTLEEVLLISKDKSETPAKQASQAG